MKKVIGLLVLMTVFAFGFGAGQYFHEKGLTIPGLAMASAKPSVTNIRVAEFDADAPHRWGVFISTNRSIDAVEIKHSTKAGLYFK